MSTDDDKKMVTRELRIRAYMRGFAEGADQPAHHTRHVVDPDTHADFRKGYEEGRRARDFVEGNYRSQLVDLDQQRQVTIDTFVDARRRADDKARGR